MALNTRPRNQWLVRLHLLLRLVGLTALLVVGVGLVVLWLWWDVTDPAMAYTEVGKVLNGPAASAAPDPVAWWTVMAALICGALVLAAVLVEVVVIGRMVAGRRSAFGFNVGLQIALALILLVGANMYSQQHYLRLDWTQDQQFTLGPEIRAQLQQLKGDRGETTIVVYQLHKTFGRLSDKPDATDYAAERKVVEKVYDLVEQLRAFGQQFNVVVLDVEEEGHDARKKEVTKDAPELKAALARAEENSIFFHDRNSGKVQRLSFNDFYLLDKTASAERGNLVLRDQGKWAFVNRVLNVDEKRPRVGVLVVHELLTTEGPEELGLAGLKKSLAASGFDVEDVVLKKWSEMAPPEPAVYTFDESKHERLEEQLNEADLNIKHAEEDLKQLEEVSRFWHEKSLTEISKKYQRQLGGRQITDAMRQRQLESFKDEATFDRAALRQMKEKRDTLAREKAGLNVEGLAERRRVADLRAKLNRTLAEFDLIVVPRMTLRNVTIGDRIPGRVYRLDDAQVAALRDYLKSGKPMLACLGPVNEPAAERFEPPGQSGADGFEELLVRLGVRLPKQTVLFNAESKSFAERKSGLLVSGVNVEVPPVEFDWVPGAGDYRLREEPPALKANPIRESMRIVSRSVGKGPDLRGAAEDGKDGEDEDVKQLLSRKLDLRLRHPRPVYLDPEREKELGVDPVFMMTSPSAWNDNNPFPTRERTPRLERSKPDDPVKGTPEELRAGPFPVGVAFETKVPRDWYDDKNASPANVRVAVIGHGGLFVGSELSPGRENLLLNVTNWLLGRDDQLAGEGRAWQFPRVPLAERDKKIWHWGTQLILPGFFAWLGFMVLLVRRMH